MLGPANCTRSKWGRIDKSRPREFGLKLLGIVRILAKPFLCSSTLRIHGQGIDEPAKRDGGRAGFESMEQFTCIAQGIFTIIAKIIAPKVKVDRFAQRTVHAGAANNSAKLLADPATLHDARWIFGKWPRLFFIVRHDDLLVKKEILA